MCSMDWVVPEKGNVDFACEMVHASDANNDEQIQGYQTGSSVLI